MRLEIQIDEGPEYMSADEIAVHSILNGYHLPSVDSRRIEDNLIGDAYAGKLGPLDQEQVDFAIQLIHEMGVMGVVKEAKEVIEKKIK
tara:strand:+ start:992 stop:1255 length:264 start_codon:yes stop_codon:yes gene_type:complete